MTGGKQLNRNLTIYQAIQRQLMLDEDDDERLAGSDRVSSDGSSLWGDIYTITYQRAENQPDKASNGGSSSNTSKSAKSGSALNSSSEAKLHQTSVLDSILQGDLPCDGARLLVLVHTYLRKMLLQCQLPQGTLMKLKFNLLWKEVFQQSLVFLEQ